MYSALVQPTEDTNIMLYIQRKDHDTNQLETVDQCDTMKEARYLRAEYALSDPRATYYISRRACRDW